MEDGGSSQIWHSSIRVDESNGDVSATDNKNSENYYESICPKLIHKIASGTNGKFRMFKDEIGMRVSSKTLVFLLELWLYF